MGVHAFPTATRRAVKPARSDLITELLAAADVAVNGGRPWDIQVYHPQTFNRFLAQGSLGIGDSYIEGWWDCEALDRLAERVLRADVLSRLPLSGTAFAMMRARLLNLQSRRRAFQIAEAHYNLGNDLFEAMLDRRMTYTCAYWNGADTLDDAQERKLDLVCRKIALEPGMRVLDIGCGWGAFAKFAAERYGVEVVGISVSQEQIDLGRRLCAGLPVELRLEDYRTTSGEFDRVVSLGMFEHVGTKNHRTFFETVRQRLTPDGLMLLHTIGANASARVTDPWIGRHIFPNSLIPSIAQIGVAIEGLFVMEDWHNFGADYDKTLMAWHRNFNTHWRTLSARYSESFRRMWRYYLLTCAGAFRARTENLWQIVLSPSGVPGGYQRPA